MHDYIYIYIYLYIYIYIYIVIVIVILFGVKFPNKYHDMWCTVITYN